MSLIIAAAQSASIPGDTAANVAHHLRFGAIAADLGVHLLIFPELSLTGYELAIARSKALGPDSREIDALRHLATYAHMTVVVGAPVLTAKGALNIAALACHPDRSISVYTKVYVHESELPVFSPGSGGPELRVNESTVALAICADATHPQHAATAASHGAIVYGVGVMIDENGYSRKVALLRNYARDHQMAVLMSNYSGATGGEVSAGKSAIWSEDGQLVAASSGTEEALVVGRRENGVWSGVVVPLA